MRGRIGESKAGDDECVGGTKKGDGKDKGMMEGKGGEERGREVRVRRYVRG